MKDVTKFYPIGTVLMLKDGTKRVMITGFLVASAEEPNKVYDYSGCVFPEGVISSEHNLLFNHDQIGVVYYMGYSDEEEKNFKQKLNSALNEISKDVSNN